MKANPESDPQPNSESNSEFNLHEEMWNDWDVPRDQLLAGEYAGGVWKRSLLLESAARIVFPTVLVFSIYLLIAGHYDAGGGFSGGLVAGLAFVVRYVAGGRGELATILRIRPLVVVGMGLTIAVVVALAPLLVGGEVLATTTFDVPLPVIGDVKIATSLGLDLGVYLLIVGVVLDLLRTLGAGIELQAPGDRTSKREGA
ncbi:multicomponent Na+:H+ antiporter subunit B [Tamaricihabitans halophyticus]|uniref:Multicomponent Na+:H+ antiporter subunit B n=1 Tax=Tamaricihabitans halophyticus TaxID=1262583 RepID=A0A4R2QYK0_9PSEU|nr:MnhB domain-containing protein [Tamaricihabitans halophyticus]TCP55342.1 multicomponent Na+:H+ antiporter subunit B [Tamaricihabitans halophyticus]